MQDTIKVRLADEKTERENCVDDSSLPNSNAKTNNNTIPENNDDTLYYITKSRVGRAKFDSTGVQSQKMRLKLGCWIFLQKLTTKKIR